MVKVLFVCTGNICRSPLAEGILRTQAVARGLEEQIVSASAGTQHHHVGQPPDPRSISIAQTRKIDIRGQRARQVQTSDFALYDVIAALDHSHLNSLQRLCPPDLRPRIRLLMSYAVPLPASLDVPDPYYGHPGFNEVFEMIEQGVSGLMAFLQTTYSLRPRP